MKTQTTAYALTYQPAFFLSLHGKTLCNEHPPSLGRINSAEQNTKCLWLWCLTIGNALSAALSPNAATICYPCSTCCIYAVYNEKRRESVHI